MPQGSIKESKKVSRSGPLARVASAVHGLFPHTYDGKIDWSTTCWSLVIISSLMTSLYGLYQLFFVSIPAWNAAQAAEDALARPAVHAVIVTNRELDWAARRATIRQQEAIAKLWEELGSCLRTAREVVEGGGE